MKIKVGGKYRMRSYPAQDSHVEIVNTDKCTYSGDIEYVGHVVSKDGFGDEVRGTLCYWGETGNWNNEEGESSNDLIEEIL